MPCLGRDEVRTVHCGLLASSVTWEEKISCHTAVIGELISACYVALTCSTTQTTPRAEGFPLGPLHPLSSPQTWALPEMNADFFPVSSGFPVGQLLSLK